ncbi:MAG TPA: MYXO-CTERM sorting domain-containing protein, partial [Polyangiaceae bacterium]
LDQPKPAITGTCAPDGDPVDVYVDGVLLGTVTCTNGAFSFTPPANLALGAHTVSATLRDPTNQLSSDPTPTNNFTIVECLSSGACGGQKPLCDTSAHVCVQCLSNNQCAGLSPICDTPTKTCRPCTSANANADCNGNGVCAEGSSDPKKGGCVQCTSNPQCTAPAICNTAQDTCVGCLVNAQCSNPKPVCGVGQTCTGCTWDADCAGRPATPACLVQSGSCVECTAANASACRGTTPVCDVVNSKCVGCNSSAECADGKTCVNQQCVGSGTDAGPVNPPDAGIDAGANPNDVAVEGGGLGCSASGGSFASAWPILGGLALALAGLRRRRAR